jgi:hypothetical protein
VIEGRLLLLHWLRFGIACCGGGVNIRIGLIHQLLRHHEGHGIRAIAEAKGGFLHHRWSDMVSIRRVAGGHYCLVEIYSVP